MKKIIAFVFLLQFFTLSSQEYFPKNDGVKTVNENYTAFINGQIHITPDQVVKNGSLLIHQGKVIGAGSNINIPKNAVVIDLKGKSIYPSFIDVFSAYGVEQAKRNPGRGRSAQYGPSREGYYWNDHIMPEHAAISVYK